MSTPKHLTSPFHPQVLTGKVAIITGGGSGICFEITKQLLLHGAAVTIICGRREQFLQDACDTLNGLVKESSSSGACLYRVCDVRDPQSCQSVVSYATSKYGKVDILVNGAAGNFLAEAKSLTPKGFRTVMEIDTMGTYNMCHAVYPAMAKNNDNEGVGGSGGVIINISMTLHYGATWYQAHASAAKSAIDSLTRTLALEWGVNGIRVNGIAPGPIKDTPGTAKLAPGLTAEDVEEMIAERVPLGRLGTGFDIAMAAIFLSCDGSGGYISGDTLVVDGAEWLYKPPMVPREMVAELSRKVEAKSRALKPKLVSKM
mmetsp:Transcript_14944/g.29043  ORF Transcript_14944/g.29043 Transcript_14944/m.29043 type:complete len:315 (-) Transcript_14944:219-1163(-)